MEKEKLNKSQTLNLMIVSLSDDVSSEFVTKQSTRDDDDVPVLFLQ